MHLQGEVRNGGPGSRDVFGESQNLRISWSEERKGPSVLVNGRTSSGSQSQKAEHGTGRAEEGGAAPLCQNGGKV